MCSDKQSQLRVTFSRSGGITGISLSAAVEATELAAEHQHIVADLIDEPDETPPHDTQRHLTADGFVYRLALDDGQLSRSFQWVDPYLPDAVRPLIETLTKQAHPS